MAEVVGLTASILQIAGAGVKLDITDIAGDVALTANVLDCVGNVFKEDDAKCLISKAAVRDATSIIQRCEDVFKEIDHLIEKRRKITKDGKKTTSALGKLIWPMKEQRVELLRRRLDSLKTSLLVLLEVLRFAGERARGILEQSAIENEREKIRQLHQRQQDSLKSLQTLESKLNGVTLNDNDDEDDNTLQGSAPPSRTPTGTFMLAQTDIGREGKEEACCLKPKQDSQAALSPDEWSSSDDETAGEDSENEAAPVSIEDLAKCTRHVQSLLKRINSLQSAFEGSQPQTTRHSRKLHKLYMRFCQKFESDVLKRKANTTAHQLPAFSPPSIRHHVSSLLSQAALQAEPRSHEVEQAQAPVSANLSASQTSLQRYSASIDQHPRHLDVEEQGSHDPPIFQPGELVPDSTQSTKQQPNLHNILPPPPTATHNIFTSIDDSRSMLDLDWGSSNSVENQPLPEGAARLGNDDTDSPSVGAISIYLPPIRILASQTPSRPTIKSEHQDQPSQHIFWHGSVDPSAQYKGSAEGSPEPSSLGKPHANSAWLKCIYCARWFSRAEDLEKHKFTHITVQSYRCSHCHKSFPRRLDLQRHSSVHGEGDGNEDLSPHIMDIEAASRVPTACANCTNAKLECDMRVPCSCCINLKIECTARPRRRQTKQSLRQATASISAAAERSSKPFSPPTMTFSSFSPQHSGTAYTRRRLPSQWDPAVISQAYSGSLTKEELPDVSQGEQRASTPPWQAVGVQATPASSITLGTPRHADIMDMEFGPEDWLQGMRPPRSPSRPSAARSVTPNWAESLPSESRLSGLRAGAQEPPINQQQAQQDQPAILGGIPAQPQGNHKLQDYEMQFMLLEQTNRKRLLLARQEQDNMTQGSYGQAFEDYFSRPETSGPSPELPNMMPSGVVSSNMNGSVHLRRDGTQEENSLLPEGPSSPQQSRNFGDRVGRTHSSAASASSRGDDPKRQNLPGIDTIKDALQRDSKSQSQPIGAKDPELANQLQSPLGSYRFPWVDNGVTQETGPMSPGVRTKGRTKALSLEQKRNAARLRVVGACKNCRVRKDRCDTDTPCRACVQHYGDDLVNHPCRGSSGKKSPSGENAESANSTHLPLDIKEPRYPSSFTYSEPLSTSVDFDYLNAADRQASNNPSATLGSSIRPPQQDQTGWPRYSPSLPPYSSFLHTQQSNSPATLQSPLYDQYSRPMYGPPDQLQQIQQRQQQIGQQSLQTQAQQQMQQIQQPQSIAANPLLISQQRAQQLQQQQVAHNPQELHTPQTPAAAIFHSYYYGPFNSDQPPQHPQHPSPSRKRGRPGKLELELELQDFEHPQGSRSMPVELTPHGYQIHPYPPSTGPPPSQHLTPQYHNHPLPNQPHNKRARMNPDIPISPLRSSPPPSMVGQPGMLPPASRPRGPKLKFTPEDDQLLIDLKEEKNLTWRQIADFYPGRSSGTLQVRYVTKLKPRSKDKSTPVIVDPTTTGQTTVALLESELVARSDKLQTLSVDAAGASSTLVEKDSGDNSHSSTPSNVAPDAVPMPSTGAHPSGIPNPYIQIAPRASSGNAPFFNTTDDTIKRRAPGDPCALCWDQDLECDEDGAIPCSRCRSSGVQCRERSRKRRLRANIEQEDLYDGDLDLLHPLQSSDTSSSPKLFRRPRRVTTPVACSSPSSSSTLTLGHADDVAMESPAKRFKRSMFSPLTDAGRIPQAPLTCVLCQQKSFECDKDSEEPCSRCQTGGEECTVRRPILKVHIEEEERDIVDVLLDMWTVPVAA